MGRGEGERWDKEEVEGKGEGRREAHPRFLQHPQFDLSRNKPSSNCRSKTANIKMLLSLTGRSLIAGISPCHVTGQKTSVLTTVRAVLERIG
jgi:hypothetical protein